MSDALVTFLKERLHEDEQAARRATHGSSGIWKANRGYGYPVEVAGQLRAGASIFDRAVVFDEGSPSEEQAAHIARHHPARVLAEVEAKRAVLAAVAGHRDGEWEDDPIHEAVLRPLAAVYADHPDYRPEWRP